MKLELIKPWHDGAMGALVSVLLGLSFLMVEPLGQKLRGLSYDLPFAFRKNIPVEEVMIVSMDEESHREQLQSATNIWDRALHIDMLKQALALGARAVVFDVLFAGPWPNPSVDQRFADLIASASNKVVLAAVLEDKLVQTGTNATMITLLFTNTAPIHSAAVSGVTRLPADPDGTLRRHFSDPTYRSLAWKTAELLGKVPADPTRPRWINYYGPRGSIRRVSYHQVLQGTNLPPDFLSGKIVFVGRNPILTPKGTDATDEYRTAYTPWKQGQHSPGVEIQATAFLNLWRGEWLEELSPGWEFLLFLFLGILFGSGLVRLHLLVAVGVAMIALIVVAIAAALLVWRAQIWFPWMMVCTVQIPAALAWSMIAHTFRLARQKEELETQLATRPSAPQPVPSPSKSPAGPDSEGAGHLPAIPDHTLLRCVGRGAYGQVWLARDILGSFRAVKIIYRKSFTSAEPFDREFRGIQNYSTISRSYPGWVDILHVGRNDPEGYFFYIMEAGDDQLSGQKIDPSRYVPKTLSRELQRRGKLPLPECLPLSLALAEALGQLHQHSLVHRDIKPSNVIFVSGKPKFADIGLVTEFSENEKGLAVSKVGTEGYNAPEGPGTPAADLYSLGKLIYEISMGRDRRAFPEMPTAVLDQPDQPQWNGLLEILLKACEPDPRRRYQKAADLHADLLKLHRSISASDENP